jgi:ribosomal protein L44E
MALPKLNENLKYEMTVPSSERAVTYRPYLVKEEKILLQAFESQDQKLAMRAMVDTIVACVNEPISSTDLSTFDVEYMFTQIRAKSVGEKSQLEFKCEKCEEMTPVSIDLTSIQIEKSDVSNIIEVTDNINIEMRYPTYDSFVKNFKEGMSESEFGFLMLEDCIVAVMTEDERILASDVSNKELNDFINSMTNAQFEKVGEFLRTVPVMKKDIEFTCGSCQHENTITLEGLQDFF